MSPKCITTLTCVDFKNNLATVMTLWLDSPRRKAVVRAECWEVNSPVCVCVVVMVLFVFMGGLCELACVWCVVLLVACVV